MEWAKPLCQSCFSRNQNAAVPLQGIVCVCVCLCVCVSMCVCLAVEGTPAGFTTSFALAGPLFTCGAHMCVRVRVFACCRSSTLPEECVGSAAAADFTHVRSDATLRDLLCFVNSCCHSRFPSSNMVSWVQASHLNKQPNYQSPSLTCTMHILRLSPVV